MRRWMMIALVAACSSSPPTTSPAPLTTPTPTTPPTSQEPDFVPDTSAPITNRVPPDPTPLWKPHPTRATAGADRCTVGDSTVLGPLERGDVAIAFGPHGGLAAWRVAKNQIGFRRLDRDGQPVGTLQAKTSYERGDALIEPKHVVAVGDRFVVLMVRWDWQSNDARWWTSVVERDGKVSWPPLDAKLAELDIIDAQAIDDRRVALLVFQAAIAKRPQQPRWQTIAIADDGSTSSTATAVTFQVDGDWQRARLGNQIGWRSAKPPHEGLFDGARVPATAAVLLAPADAIEAHVENLARPMPRSPNGTQIHEMARPALVRKLAGKPVGQTTQLLENGNPVGVTGFMMNPATLVWTGSRFLYAYRDHGSARLLPIDCR